MMTIQTSLTEPDAHDALKDFFHSANVQVDERWFLLKSADPPTIIELITTLNGWMELLGIGAGVYVSSIITAAGQEHWAKRKEGLAKIQAVFGSQIETIKKFVVALRKTAGSKQSVTISIKTDKVKFKVPLTSDEEAIDTIACNIYFFQRIHEVIEEIKDRVDPSDYFYGHVVAEMKDTGFKLTWTKKHPGGAYEQFSRDYDFEGKPLGDVYNPR